MKDSSSNYKCLLGCHPLYLQETVTASVLPCWGGVTLAFVVYWGKQRSQFS